MPQIVDLKDCGEEIYGDYIEEDTAINLEREFYNGIASFDDDSGILGALIWHSKDSGSTKRSELEFFRASDDGTGKGLLDEYTLRAGQEEVRSSFFELSDLGDDLKKVLKKAGFKLEEKEGRDLYEDLQSALELKIAKKNKFPSNIKPLGQISSLQYRRGITNAMFSGRMGIEGDLPVFPTEWLDDEVSCCILEDDKAVGLFLIRKLPSGILMPILLFSSGMDAQKNMLIMIRYAIRAAEGKYPGDTKILIRRDDERIKNLTDYLFPGSRGAMVTRGERSESSS